MGRKMSEWLKEANEELERIEAKKTYKYRDPVTNEVFEYDRKGLYKKNSRTLIPVE
jgi:hypothetical protein